MFNLLLRTQFDCSPDGDGASNGSEGGSKTHSESQSAALRHGSESQGDAVGDESSEALDSSPSISPISILMQKLHRFSSTVVKVRHGYVDHRNEEFVDQQAPRNRPRSYHARQPSRVARFV